MKIKIRIYLVLVTMIAVFLSFAGTAFAADTTFNLTSGAAGVKVGDTVTFTVSGQDIKDMNAYEIRITFDRERLEPVEGKAVSIIQGGAAVPIIKENQITLAFAKNKGKAAENGNLSLASFTFKTIASGTAKVTLDSVKLLDGILAESSFTASKTASVAVSGGTGGDGPGGDKPGEGPAIPAGGDKAPGEAVINKTPGEIVINIKAQELQAAIGNATGRTVNINAGTIGQAGSVIMNIPAGAVRTMGRDMILRIDSGLAVISIPSDILMGMLEVTSVNLRLSVSKADIASLPEEIRSIIGSNPVYDLHLSVDGRKISDFGGSIKIALDYTLKAGEDPNRVVVYYINDNGRLEVVKNGKYNPETGKVEFSLKHFSKYAAVHVNAAFNDIEGVPWAKGGIEALAARGIIEGTDGSTFEPNRNVTRAQFAKMLLTALDLLDESAECDLSDVGKEAWYYVPVASAHKLGIVKGYGNGRFGVEDKISREDMAAMVYRAAQLLDIRLEEGVTPGFSDRGEISSYALEAVAAMEKNGIISGVGGRFAPKELSTRAQAAVVIYRLFQLCYK